MKAIEMKKLRTLIVEDSPAVQNMFTERLQQIESIEIARRAFTRADAYEALRDKTFDVVVLDISLPDGSGLDVLLKIK